VPFLQTKYLRTERKTGNTKQRSRLSLFAEKGGTKMLRIILPDS
jgi:hypothetical protein